MKKFTDSATHDCIQKCWECRDTCQATLYNYCLEQGGHHVEQSHVRLMADSIQICQTAADFMTRGSALHGAICGACAEVCEACADSCGTMDDDEMKACAEVCRECADSCREMSRMTGAVARQSEPARPATPPM